MDCMCPCVLCVASLLSGHENLAENVQFFAGHKFDITHNTRSSINIIVKRPLIRKSVCVCAPGHLLVPFVSAFPCFFNVQH